MTNEQRIKEEVLMMKRRSLWNRLLGSRKLSPKERKQVKEEYRRLLSLKSGGSI